MLYCFRQVVLSVLVALSAAWPVLADDRPMVVASIRPLSLLVRDVAGDHVQLSQLLPDGQEPHHVALSFSQRRALADADLLAWIGPGLESYIARVVATRSEDRVVTAQSVLTSDDPHLWLNPEAGRAVFHLIADRLVALYPALADTIEARRRAFETRFQQALADWRATFAKVDNGHYLADHDAYRHFTDFFGLPAAGALTTASGQSLGARSLEKLYNTEEVACVVSEYSPPPEAARQLGTRLGVPVVAIDPQGTAIALDRKAPDGYLSLLAAVAEGFGECFGIVKDDRH